MALSAPKPDRVEGSAYQKEKGPFQTSIGQAGGRTGGVPENMAADPTYIADVWLDELSLSYIRVQGFSPGDLERYGLGERKRVVRRSQCYYMVSGRLYRRMSGGEAKEVPSPETRAAIVQGIHDQSGHFGRRRTMHLLMLRYWWTGMYSDVKNVITNCPSCSRVTSSNFGARSLELQPLPIMGMFYRWHVDLAGPFPKTARGNTYVMVCVEAFSKHAELIPIPSKDTDVTAHAFLHNVIARFGACAEVVTDQGTEWDSDFYDMLTDAFIDHRRTSANRPQSNGLAERCVQTLKTCLRKQISGMKGVESWDKLVAWIALGYRVTPHETTKLAPYQMLYAVAPIIPPNVKARLQEPINMDGSVAAALQLARRAEEVQRSCIIAGWNAAIAQHRDTLRYAKLRSGAYLPKLKRYEEGDYVYVKYRTKPNTLQPQVRPEILRVLQVRPGKNGHELVLRLQGRDGRTIDEHFSNCVPCHLPIEDETLQLGSVPIDFHCQQCGFPDDGPNMLRCDGCDQGWHLYCLQPALDAVPEGRWYCDSCTKHRDMVAARPAQNSRVSPVAVPVEQSADAAGPSDPARTSISPAKVEKKVVRWSHVEIAGRSNQQPGKDVVKPGQAAIPLRSSIRRWPAVRPEGQVSTPMTTSVSPARKPGTVLRIPHLRVAGSTDVSPGAWLPQHFQLDTSEGVMTALQILMPGPWSEGHATRLKNKCPGGDKFLQTSNQQNPGEPQRVLTTTAEVQSLLEAIDFGCVNSIADMFAGENNISQALGRAVVTNDINPAMDTDYHLDALQPETYWNIRQKHGMDAVVTSPYFSVLDLALPLAVKFATMVVCCHVPGHYLTDAPVARMRWLQSLQCEDRLYFIMGLPRGPMGRRCVWLVIFKSKEVCSLMRRPFAGFSTFLHYAVEQDFISGQGG